MNVSFRSQPNGRLVSSHAFDVTFRGVFGPAAAGDAIGTIEHVELTGAAEASGGDSFSYSDTIDKT